MCHISPDMVPPWPFKKKPEPVEESPTPVVYQRGQGDAAQTLADTSHTENNDFKSAMAALSVPHLSGPQQEVPTKEFVQSSDGYWYLKKADGSFEPTAYVKDAEGNYTPYAA